ncbi:hypothetical protein K2F40_03500 [Clostridium sp. CM028]|uniref:DUF6873 family GME fold protein n=1 Tax=unclassified Clostridium TaxID=2614128 RepID=UPI001C0CE8BF|nr:MULTISPECIES: hypothetical protein [unclassified Clostridium]MBU3092466.1 hypothetical protein [Clostridium sp. CF011]MBW9148042.1 hypothetical protein [Clostridium sp. CM028]WAG69782.1 hypothetical protein LL036_17750 [Clostridium sp. CF011]WLC61466.1 hypothetical protein KTC94_15555 [Clostridium sp. CM028]
MKNIIVDFRIHNEEKEYLVSRGYNLLICPPSNILYEAVCGHPDMLMHILGKDIIVHKDMDNEFILSLILLNYKVYKSNSTLKDKYPYDICLNSLSLGNLFIHSVNFTDTNLLSLLKTRKLINVKQGYTKCSTCIVNDHAVITSDVSIAKALSIEKIDILLIPPGDIILPGLNYGFIGGVTGLIEDNVLAFYGHLDHYLYGKEVLNFLNKHKVEPVFLRNGKLIDRGSIFRV